MPRKPKHDWKRENWSRTNTQVRHETGLSIVSIMKARRKAKTALPANYTLPLQEHITWMEAALDAAGVPAWENGQRLPTSERVLRAAARLRKLQEHNWEIHVAA